MDEVVYLVFLEEKENSGLELGVFSDRSKAIKCFAEKVQACQMKWENAQSVDKVVKIGSPDQKTVCWSQKDFSQTWHFQKINLNEIKKVC
jgi:hypothetical protein